MKWYWYLICTVLIVVGVFCAVNLEKIFNVQSAEYGKVMTIESKNDYEEISKFDLGSLTFESEDYSNYTLNQSFGAIDFNGNENIILLFNDQPLSNVVINAGKVSGELVLNFYNTDGTKDTTAILHILIEYYASGTVVTLTITNNNNSVAYLTAYSNINGATIKVLERSK